MADSDKLLPRPDHSTTYGFASLPNIRCGFRSARSKIVCAKTLFAHANQLPAAFVSNNEGDSEFDTLTCVISDAIDVD